MGIRYTMKFGGLLRDDVVVDSVEILFLALWPDTQMKHRRFFLDQKQKFTVAPGYDDLLARLLNH